MHNRTDFRAIVFDLDGTLVDSEPIHAEAWLTVLGRYDLHFDHHWFSRWIGLSDRLLAENVVNDHQLTQTARHLQDEKQALYHQLTLTELQPFAGVADTLADLAAHYPLALATNSSRLDVSFVFRATGLGPMFRQVVTADDVSQLKPAPDMYLQAAAGLGIAPAHCLAVEDSPAGIAAAARAGMYVLGVATSQRAENLAEAHEIFEETGSALVRAKALLLGAAGVR